MKQKATGIENRGDNRGDNHGIDTLLRQTLKDDLPPAAAEGMQRRLDRFREKMETAPQRRPVLERLWTGLMESLRPVPVMQVLKAGLMAAASIVLVVAGSLLQTDGSKNALAESISTWNAAIHTYNGIRGADAMACTVNISAGEDPPVQYTVRWLSDGGVSVQAASPARLTAYEPLLEKHLSRRGLTALLDGQWVYKNYRRVGTCEWGTFDVVKPDFNKPGAVTRVEVTADLCTCLPEHMKLTAHTVGVYSVNVHFDWNPAPAATVEHR